MPDNLSSTITSRIGSPPPAATSSFYPADEHYLGLSQSDYFHENSFTTSYRSRNSPLGDFQASSSQFISHEGLYESQFSNLSQIQKLLHLKQKLLGDPDDSNAVNHNLQVKATPKAILKLMDTEGLTIFHVKSHLQKYRNAKYIPESIEGKTEKKTSTNNSAEIDIKAGMQLKEALQLQLDVQRRLHEQLEIQKNLQMRIEEQGKQLKMMFDQQQKTTQDRMQTNNTSNECPNNNSFHMPEDHEIFILEGSDDDMDFQSMMS
ncbi:myb-like HTH transcriptional regulator family protein [Striga hermonthica]|uniref:Myb-like HTH transcriptional regulator family protein n=1 Tax=Striga hermonthica TaxID=68872 RepID=A0A9N7MRV6_STRHE|nr:myb-like HTH transcriptional regulator family protein [Striga hermonthica]